MRKEIISPISSKGQVTIPKAVRQQLGVEAGQNISFIIENNQVRIEPLKFTLDTLYGSVKPNHYPEDFKQLIRDAKQEHYQRRLKKLRNQ